MNDPERQSPAVGNGGSDRRQAAGRDEPKRNWLRRIIGSGPEAKKRLGEAVGALLGTVLVSLAVLGGLLIWHLIRRGRLIRERQAPPRIVRLPELTTELGEPRDEDDLPAP